jgi:hypothetical protein
MIGYEPRVRLDEILDLVIQHFRNQERIATLRSLVQTIRRERDLPRYAAQ